MNSAIEESVRRRADEFWCQIAEAISHGSIPLVLAVELSTEGPARWAALVPIRSGRMDSGALKRSAVPLRRMSEAIPRRSLAAGVIIVGRLAAWEHSSPVFREAAALLHKAWVDGTGESFQRASAFLESKLGVPRIAESQNDSAIQVLHSVDVLLLARQQQQNPFHFTARDMFFAASEVLEHSEIAKINFDLGPPSADEVVNAAAGVVQW